MTMNYFLTLELGLTCKGDELKDVKIDHEDDGVCNFYLTASDRSGV